MTEWRSIANLSRYEISDDGRVRNIARGKELKPHLNHRGYLNLNLQEDVPTNSRGIKYWKVHRLVAMAFLPNPDDLPEVNHKDLNKTNNAVANLEWVSHRDNHRHCHVMGKYSAVANPERRRKMTPELVMEVRDLASRGETYVAIAKHIGIRGCTVARIVRGETWAELPGAIPGKRRTLTKEHLGLPRKMSAEKVADIRRMAASGASYAACARQFGISSTHAWRIINAKDAA